MPMTIAGEQRQSFSGRTHFCCGGDFIKLPIKIEVITQIKKDFLFGV
jgi:hypothetical protein